MDAENIEDHVSVHKIKCRLCHFNFKSKTLLTLKIIMKKKQTATTTAKGIKYSCNGNFGFVVIFIEALEKINK